MKRLYEFQTVDCESIKEIEFSDDATVQEIETKVHRELANWVLETIQFYGYKEITEPDLNE